MSLLALNSNLDKIVQTFTLARYLGDALFPAMLFRASATREEVNAGEGPTIVGTTRALAEPNIKPRRPGVPRPFIVPDFEHYIVTLDKWGDPVAIDMPSNFVTITPSFWESQHTLALQAAATMNRLPRNALYKSYLEGHAIIDAVDGPGTTLTVSSLNGFRFQVDPNTGIPVPTSSAAPRPFFLNGVAVLPATSQIIGATPADSNYPDGPGTLTLSAAAGAVAGQRIDTDDAAVIIRPGGAPSVDGITAGDVLTLDHIHLAVQSLREDNVGPCEDGYYHVHFAPSGETQLHRDNAFQRQIETRGLDDEPFLSFATGRGAGCDFFSNNETPLLGTVSNDGLFQSRPVTAAAAQVSDDIGAEMVNAAGIQIMRTIVIGGGALVERYIDESNYMSDAGVAGRVGGFKATNDSVMIDLDGIRWIIKSPQDPFNEQVTAAWSFSGAWATPTNRLSGMIRPGNRRPAHKRARVIEAALVTSV